MSDQGLVVNRWRRYGKDRLYVSMADETKVGFWDLVTGEAYPETPEHLPVLVGAFEGWKAEQGTDSPGGPTPVPVADMASEESAPPVPENLVPPVSGSAAPAARPWIDLTTNQPGAKAREQAQAARDAAPVRTVLARVRGVHT